MSRSCTPGSGATTVTTPPTGGSPCPARCSTSLAPGGSPPATTPPRVSERSIRETRPLPRPLTSSSSMTSGSSIHLSTWQLGAAWLKRSSPQGGANERRQEQTKSAPYLSRRDLFRAGVALGVSAALPTPDAQAAPHADSPEAAASSAPPVVFVNGRIHTMDDRELGRDRGANPQRTLRRGRPRHESWRPGREGHRPARHAPWCRA